MRFLKICWILSKYTLLYRLSSHSQDNFGKRLKLACEELGITFIKIGQILSMRYDVLSKQNCAELQGLLDNVRPIPYIEVIKIIETEYQKPYQSIFKIFYQEPLGSASVSQVHRAELLNGSIVAVKIKRPNVNHQFLNDIAILKTLARVCQSFSVTLRNIQVRKLVDSFEAWIKQDMDFVGEVRNIKKITEQYSFASAGFRSDLGKALFPSTFDELCTPNIIVMDFIDGIPMNRKAEILANPNYDIEKSISSYVNAAMRNWFREDTQAYYFQADPHLSNILALPNGDAATIDFGLISELSKKEARICQDLMIAVYLKDIKQVMKFVSSMIGIDQARCEIMRPDLERYLEQTQHEGLGFWFLEVIRIVVKYRFKFPLFLATFGRTNLLLDGVIHEYMPAKTTLDLFGEELRRLAFREAWKNVLEADWLKLTYAVSQKIKEGPNIIGEFLDNPLGLVSQIVQTIKN